MLQEYEVQLTFRQQWNDERLKFDDHEGKNINLNLKSPKHILGLITFSLTGKVPFVIVNDVNRFWIPDLFFSDEREGKIHNLIVPNSYLRIHPNGEVIFSMR